MVFALTTFPRPSSSDVVSTTETFFIFFYEFRYLRSLFKKICLVSVNIVNISSLLTGVTAFRYRRAPRNESSVFELVQYNSVKHVMYLRE
jgi:hypothetical protein